MDSLRRITLAISFNTCTLSIPPDRTTASARSALSESTDKRHSRILLSMNLVARIRLIPIKSEIGRQLPPILPQLLEKGVLTRFFLYLEYPFISNHHFNVVAFAQLQCFNH